MAIDYYNLKNDGTIRDMILSIRADESVHRDVNHRVSDIKPDTDVDKEFLEFVNHDSRFEHISGNKKITHNM